MEEKIEEFKQIINEVYQLFVYESREINSKDVEVFWECYYYWVDLKEKIAKLDKVPRKLAEKEGEVASMLHAFLRAARRQAAWKKRQKGLK